MAENFELIFAADYDKPNAPMHCHNGVELVMVERGSCTVEFQGFGCMNATAGQVFVNGRLVLSASEVPPEGAIVSVRHMGRFVYRGVKNATRKGRLFVTVDRYV